MYRFKRQSFYVKIGIYFFQLILLSEFGISQELWSGTCKAGSLNQVFGDGKVDFSSNSDDRIKLETYWDMLIDLASGKEQESGVFGLPKLMPNVTLKSNKNVIYRTAKNVYRCSMGS